VQVLVTVEPLFAYVNVLPDFDVPTIWYAVAV
jgi:hypothetical protein